MKEQFWLFIILLVFINEVSAETPLPSSPETPSFDIVPVTSVSIPANRLLVGGTVAAHKSVVLSAQLPGRITNIAGEEGDSFKKGQLLVKINDDELLAKRRIAEAALASAASAMHNSRVQFSRQIISPSTSNNAPGGMGMPGMFDQVFTNPMANMMGTRHYGVERGADIYANRSQLEQANYAVGQAQSQIQQIDTRLRDTQSIAPFNGVIVKKLIEVGDTVQPGQTLLVFEDLSRLQIVVDVPGRLTNNLHEGDTVSARIDGTGREINVRVDKVFPTSDPVRHTTRVKFTLPDNSGVAAGNYAEVWIPVAKSAMKKRLQIPITAVIERGGIPSVFVVNKENRATLRLVRVGDIMPSGDVVILYGVKEGDRVLDKPASYITSGYQLNQ